MSSAIFRIKVKPEKTGRFEAIVGEIADVMRSNEPDARIYALWKTKKANEYLLFESYLNQAAFVFHEGQHVPLLKEFLTIMDGPPEIENLGDFVVGVPDVGTLPFAPAEG